VKREEILIHFSTMCDKGEFNYVAKAQNWDQRVKAELDFARVSVYHRFKNK
jgi:hypothetical protein